ncbi:hypothetical protein [Desulfovibrio sp. DV]|nr:hypothetical protein [Desulfovibrio sp. DV]
MATIMPQGELTRRAVKWIDEGAIRASHFPNLSTKLPCSSI